MPAKRAIYRARWVLGFRDGGHRLIDNGEIAIEDSRVTYVGPRSVAPLADGVEVREFSEGGFCFPASSHRTPISAAMSAIA
jgi:cytosine/adenosine deaminase-related metal-dependent hydrolase